MMHTPGSAASATGARPRLALVVDDDAVTRVLLERHLRTEGYGVRLAETGRAGLNCFMEELPDIVFLDVMLPDLTGQVVASQMKALAGERFIPIVFLTSLDANEALAACIDAGGDEFMSKPLNFSILHSRTKAVERIRDLYENTRQQKLELTHLHERLRYEQDVAENILNGAIMSRNINDDSIATWIQPASTFNGDIFISTRSPDGGISILLGDFTGHGLVAAIGALPTSEIFRAMISKGFDLMEVLETINTRLADILPPEMFLAAAVFQIEPETPYARVLNLGLPDILHLDRQRRLARIRTTHPPLGALAHMLEDISPQFVHFAYGDAFIFYSDGLIEATRAHEQFGEERLFELCTQCAPEQAFATIKSRLEDFTQGQAQNDDITLVSILCKPFAPPPQRKQGGTPAAQHTEGGWHWALTLSGARLAETNPVPLFMAQLTELGVPAENRQELFVICSELFSNALEHGILALDSSAKSQKQGFIDYYTEQQSRLEHVVSGEIAIHASMNPGNGGRPMIRLEIADSGPGFAYEATLAALAGAQASAAPHGRGLLLATSLCAHLEFLPPGNRVIVEYPL